MNRDFTSFDTHLKIVFPPSFLGGSRAMGWARDGSDTDIHVLCADTGCALVLAQLAARGFEIDWCEQLTANYVCRAIDNAVEYKFLESSAWHANRKHYFDALVIGLPRFDTSKTKIENYRHAGIPCESITDATASARRQVKAAFLALTPSLPIDTSKGYPFYK